MSTLKYAFRRTVSKLQWSLYRLAAAGPRHLLESCSIPILFCFIPHALLYGHRDDALTRGHYGRLNIIDATTTGHVVITTTRFLPSFLPLEVNIAVFLCHPLMLNIAAFCYHPVLCRPISYHPTCMYFCYVCCCRLSSWSPSC